MYMDVNSVRGFEFGIRRNDFIIANLRGNNIRHNKVTFDGGLE